MDSLYGKKPSSLKKFFDWFFRLFGLFAFCFLILGFASALFASKWLVVHEQAVKADAIVVLAGHYTRPLYAAELYQQAYSNKIFVSRPIRAEVNKLLTTLGIALPVHEDVYMEILVRKDVSPADIIMYGKDVLSTVEEAESLAASMTSTPQRLLIVTSPTHTRRAKIIFSHVFPHTEIILLATPYEKFPQRWWQDRTAAVNLVLEFSKTIFYYFGGAFRSTDKG